MSRENVDLVGTLIPQGTDIAPLFRSERAFARVSEVLAPLVEEDFENVVSVPGQTRTDEGVEGLRRNWLDWLEPWAEYRVSIEEVVDLGERVLVLTRH